MSSCVEVRCVSQFRAGTRATSRRGWCIAYCVRQVSRQRSGKVPNTRLFYSNDVRFLGQF